MPLYQPVGPQKNLPHDGSVGLVYLPTSGWFLMAKYGTCRIHGSVGYRYTRYQICPVYILGSMLPQIVYQMNVSLLGGL